MSAQAAINPELPRRFSRLCIADLSFRQCKALSEHMLKEHLDVSCPAFSPQVAGIVVTYAKNFVAGAGFGPLGSSYGKFPEASLQETHDLLIEMRNKVYAHRDVLAAKTFKYEDSRRPDPYEVRLEIREGEPGFTLFPNIPDLITSHLPFIIRLCEFQIERIGDEFRRILPLMTTGKNYQAGVYTIGVDFP